jgi:hypothetical protein
MLFQSRKKDIFNLIFKKTSLQPLLVILKIEIGCNEVLCFWSHK